MNNLFKTGSKKKGPDKSVDVGVVHYQVIGHGGIRDGTTLTPGETFIRTWTIMNTNSNTREKGKVLKFVQAGGLLMKDQLFFLWPIPGKSVTVTLNLIAPLEPGSYESSWRIEGPNKADFSIKFEVQSIRKDENILASEEKPSEKTTIGARPQKKQKSKKRERNSRRSVDSRRAAMRKMSTEGRLTPLITLTAKTDEKWDSSKDDSQENGKLISVLSQPENISSDPADRLKKNLEMFEMITPRLKGEEVEEPKMLQRAASFSLASPVIVRRQDTNTTEASSSETTNSTNKDSIPPKSSKRIDISYASESESNQQDSNKDNPPSSFRPKSKSKELVVRWQDSILEESNKKLAKEHQKKATQNRERRTSLQNLHSSGVKKIVEKAEQPISISTPSVHSSNGYRFSRQVSAHLPVTIKETDAFSLAQRNISKLIYYSCKLEQIVQDFPQQYENVAHLLLSSSAPQNLQKFNEFLQSISSEICDAQNSIERKDSATYLPSNIWLRIFSFLNVKDICTVSTVCKGWGLLSKHNSLWKNKYHAKVGEKMGKNSILTKNFRFQSLYKIEEIYAPKFCKEEWQIDNNFEFIDTGTSWPISDVIPVGHSLFTLSDCVRQFDLKKKIPSGVYPGHEKLVTCAAVSEDVSVCVTGSDDQTIKIWSLDQQECISTLVGHGTSISNVLLYKDIIISSSSVGSLYFWNISTGEKVFELDKEFGKVNCLTTNLTNCSNQIYLGKSNGIVSLWDIETRKEVQSTRISQSPILGLQIIDDLLIASTESKIHVKPFSIGEGEIESSLLSEGVGKLAYNGFTLGAQSGSKLLLYDIRYLFQVSSQLRLGGDWRGAFSFYNDSVFIGSDDGKILNWK